MRKNRAVLTAVIFALLCANTAIAQSPDAPWCTPQTDCSIPFNGSGNATFGPWLLPATAQTIGVVIAGDAVTGSGTATLLTAPCASFGSSGCSTAGTFTSCGSGTLNTTPTAPLSVTCASSSTTAGWAWFELTLSGGTAGTYHGRGYAQGPNLSGITGFPITLFGTSIPASSNTNLLQYLAVGSATTTYGSNVVYVGSGSGTGYFDSVGPTNATKGLFAFRQLTSGATAYWTFLGSDAAGNALFHAAVQPGSTTVASLPTASSSTGMLYIVSDSTAVSAEGQTCAGSSTNKALALSNGTVWKCF